MYISTVPTHVLMHTFSLTRIEDSVGIHTRIHYTPLGSSWTAISHMQKRRAPRHANIETKLSSGSDGTRERFAKCIRHRARHGHSWYRKLISPPELVVPTARGHHRTVHGLELSRYTTHGSAATHHARMQPAAAAAKSTKDDAPRKPGHPAAPRESTNVRQKRPARPAGRRRSPFARFNVKSTDSGSEACMHVSPGGPSIGVARVYLGRTRTQTVPIIAD